MSIMLAVFLPIAGKLCDKIGIKVPIVTSMIIATITFICFSFITEDSPRWLFPVALLIYGISCGINIPSTFNGAISSVDDKHRSIAVGIFFTITFLGSSIGVALNGVALSGLSIMRFNQLIQMDPISLTPLQRDDLTQAINGAHNIAMYTNDFSRFVIDKITPMVHYSFMYGFRGVMITNMCLMLLGLLFALQIKTNKMTG